MRRLLAYAQLVRLPNVFTALSDIGLGALGSGALSERWPMVIFLALTSACMYCGGMVWNDLFDLEEDRRERPFRPLPSGRITRRQALRLGVLLLGTGLVFAFLAGFFGPTHYDYPPKRGAPAVIVIVDAGYLERPIWIAGFLVLVILLYDGWLKRTFLGPLIMGTCRLLNVLLGWTVAGEELGATHASRLTACIVGLYIIGVTCFARTEARTSNRGQLAAASLIILASLLLALPLPLTVLSANAERAPSPLFVYLLVGYGFLLGMPLCQALAVPSAACVQTAIKRAILGLIVLDAVLATALAGDMGLVLLFLLPPALYLGRWVYST